jgi:hypothetical protein
MALRSSSPTLHACSLWSITAQNCTPLPLATSVRRETLPGIRLGRRVLRIPAVRPVGRGRRCAALSGDGLPVEPVAVDDGAPGHGEAMDRVHKARDSDRQVRHAPTDNAAMHRSSSVQLSSPRSRSAPCSRRRSTPTASGVSPGGFRSRESGCLSRPSCSYWCSDPASN